MTDKPALPAPMVPAERAQAIARGAVRYFTGLPCPQGHKAERYTLGGYCVVCQRAATRDNKAAAKARRSAA